MELTKQETVHVVRKIYSLSSEDIKKAIEEYVRNGQLTDEMAGMKRTIKVELISGGTPVSAIVTAEDTTSEGY